MVACPGNASNSSGPKTVFLLNPEAVARHIEVHSRRLVDRVVVPTFLPSRLHAVKLAERGDFAAGGDAAAFGHSDADVVDEALADQREIFVDIDEQLAHSLRRGALLAHESVPADLLG